MVNIELPLNITFDPTSSSIEVLGIELKYAETIIQLRTTLTDMIAVFRNAIQFKEGDPQDTVDVSIRDRTSLVNALIQIFKTNMFVTDMSVPQPMIDYLSEALAVELSRNLGLNAIASFVQITPHEEVFSGLAESIVSNIESTPLLRQFLYEQYLHQSPERFFPGKDDVYAPIPFAEGDLLSFFLTLRFQEAAINGNEGLLLTNFLQEQEMPVVKCIVRFSFSS